MALTDHSALDHPGLIGHLAARDQPAHLASMRRWILIVPLALSACAPDQVGQQVGQSLYDASVSTGHALATFGDRTGEALQDAGANLRNAVSPPTSYPSPAYALPPGLPPAYGQDGEAPPGSITVEPLASPGGAPDDGPSPVTPPNPPLGY